MNGKKAKALRRIARQETRSNPITTYIAGDKGNVLVAAQSTRGVTKFFKKQILAGAVLCQIDTKGTK